MAVTAPSGQLARVGPVHFQPLERELSQVAKYLRGNLLNAGCGNRDISALALGKGVVNIVNYDIESSIEGAVLGPLHATPFADGEFDTVFCNAVLEHVADIDSVMREMVRVLRPGGHFIAAVPFLQPYHPDPTDFRRYTRAGLEELGRMHGLDAIEILPLHTIWQTLGWIAWRWSLEKGGVRPFAIYPIVWLTTRFFNRTDNRVVDNANTFQVVWLR